MSSRLYIVKVMEVAGPRAVLRVAVANPDVTWDLTGNLGFVMQLLRDEVADEDTQFGAAVSEDDIVDSEWLEANARAYIESVSTATVSGSLDGNRADGNNLIVDYTIQATHPAWVAHLAALEPGLEWDSAAYDEGAEFQECAPAVPA